MDLKLIASLKRLNLIVETYLVWCKMTTQFTVFQFQNNGKTFMHAVKIFVGLLLNLILNFDKFTGPGAAHRLRFRLVGPHQNATKLANGIFIWLKHWLKRAFILDNLGKGWKSDPTKQFKIRFCSYETTYWNLFL